MNDIVKEWEDPVATAVAVPTVDFTNSTQDEVRVVVQVPKRVRLTNKESGIVSEYDVNEDRVLVWPPGATRTIPEHLSRAVHLVTRCGHVNCRGGVCVTPGAAGPSAVLSGGGAPQLTRAGQKYRLDPSLTDHLRPGASRSMVETVAAPSPAHDPGEGALARARARKAAAR